MALYLFSFFVSQRFSLKKFIMVRESGNENLFFGEPNLVAYN